MNKIEGYLAKIIYLSTKGKNNKYPHGYKDNKRKYNKKDPQTVTKNKIV